MPGCGSSLAFHLHRLTGWRFSGNWIQSAARVSGISGEARPAGRSEAKLVTRHDAFCSGGKNGDEPSEQQCGQCRAGALPNQKSRDITDADTGKRISHRSRNGTAGFANDVEAVNQ